MNGIARELLRQIGNVAADLPRFVTAPLYRSWHLRWGTTDAEVPRRGQAMICCQAQFNPAV